QNASRIGGLLEDFFIVNFDLVRAARSQSNQNHGLLIFRETDAQIGLGGAPSNDRARQGQRRGGSLQVDRNAAALPKQLSSAIEISEPLRRILPVGSNEEPARHCAVINEWHVCEAETGLIRIRPKEFVGGTEGAAQHEVIVHQPALQILDVLSVGVVGDHGQFGGAGKGG